MDKLGTVKKAQIKVAKQLVYPEEVIEKIRNAKTVYEIDRIMTQARLDLKPKLLTSQNKISNNRLIYTKSK